MIGVNPIRTGYNAVADDWVGITPGTDGLVHPVAGPLTDEGRQDRPGLSGALHQCAGSGERRSKIAEYGLFLRDDDGKPLVMDRDTGKLTPLTRPACSPTCRHHRAAGITHRPVFHLMAERYLIDEYAPEAVAERCGIRPNASAHRRRTGARRL